MYFIYSERNVLKKKRNKVPKKKKLLLLIIISVVTLIMIVVFIFLIILLKIKNISLEIEEQVQEQVSEKLTKELELINGNFKKLEKEFEIITNVGDLKRVSVVQKSSDEAKLNDNIISTEIKRKTNYDIYTISEEDSNEENKLFYSKMYTLAISIVSECITTDDQDCEPQKLIDLTSESKKSNNNIRRLATPEDFKDIPLPLCLFNITDNNFITSMTCPESLSESKKNEIILDLYFFRPPLIQRADKENDNITITINEDMDNNKRYIRETNGGLCNIYNNFGSSCTTDMNTTTDLKGNLLSYDEIAITNILTDESNYYIKKKVTNLIDISKNIDYLDPIKYKDSLDKLLPMLEPHMKDDIHFTIDNFTDLYNLVLDKSKSAKKKNNHINKNKKTPRSLMEFASTIVKEQSLFSYVDTGGIQINLNLKADSGINTEAMRQYSNINFDNQENELTYLEEFTDIHKIIDNLIELSKAGNHLATQLYEKTKEKLEGITDEISLRITSLNDLLMYYDLSEIFDSTLSLDSISKLPISIISESNSLVSNLKEIYNGIKSGNMKRHADNLNNNIYEYIKQSHILIKKLFDNLKELGNTLNSKNNKLTEITTYYLNHTSSSYINTIQEAENILDNYFKNEYNLILPKVQELLKEFEDNYNESLQKEKKIIDNLYTKLENKSFTIEYASDEDYKNIILNLYNSDKYISDIISEIKGFIHQKIGLKENGYFISDYDINSNNKSFSSVLKEAKEVAQKLDNDEYIDKTFDEIMINFRDNYTNIMKYMDTQKSEQFPLDENTLKDSSFTSSEKNKIETEMTTFKVEISNKINEENNYYLENINNYISQFLNADLETLNDLISDLDISLFSEEKLKYLSGLFDTAFNSCLNKIKKDLETNELLAKQYFDNLYNIINNGNKLIELLKSYKLEDIANSKKFSVFLFIKLRKYYKKFVDQITSKEKTNAYILKYNTFIASLTYSKNYLDNQLYLDILNTYKTTLTKIRVVLQSIKNNKITTLYPDFKDLKFYDDHLETIDKLFIRLNNSISDDIFNKKYIPLINTNKVKDNSYVNTIKNYINNKHTPINKLKLYNDNSEDFCLTYKRKVCYGCTNCAWYSYLNEERYCLNVQSYTNNHLKLIKSEISSDSNLIKFNKEFNNFYNEIYKKINNYNQKLKTLQNGLINIKQQTLNKKITMNYLKPVQDSVNSLLNEKYGNEIIKDSYNYYKKLIDERLKNILDDVSNKWNDSYTSLISEIDKNYDNFKNSIYEFGVMGQIYENLIKQNITRNYFDSIVLFQKTEFNYTISYYYNYYLKIINEVHQYILSKIPINKNGFNDILTSRKNEVNTVFNNLKNTLIKSKNEALTIKKQLEVLQVAETNFFKANSILTDNILKTDNILSTRTEEIYDYEGVEGDEYSLVSRFYLENKENGKQIEQFYDPVNHQIFVYLNLEKFKDLMLENWIFDQDDFINRLNKTLYDSNKEIENELSTQKEIFKDKLESQITQYFQDDTIENKINNMYVSEVKDLTTNQINLINSYINNILNKIKEHISTEVTRMKTTSTSYNSNYTTIINTLNGYKNTIFTEINSTIFNVLDGFYKNIYNNAYINYIEKYMNKYIVEAKKEIVNYGEYLLLNSSYQIGETIDNILEGITKSYKDRTSKKIKAKYEEYYQKIGAAVNINNIKNLINNEITNAYTKTLLPALKQYAIYTPGHEQYTEYDFSDNIKNNINTIITQNINNIKNQILNTKGSNYNAKVSWQIMDFSRVNIEVVYEICNSFQKFLKTEKEEQNSKIKNEIKNIIKSNFEDLLNNIIPSFGNNFFERIIKYNENFKIINLYDNLKYSLSQTLLYYITLDIYKDVDALPKDLKIRLFNLNDLDSTIKNKNKQILNLLEKKINEFITESKKTIIEKYMSYLQEDVSIQLSFSSTLLEKINDNLIESMPQMEKNYQDMLQKYLKEKLLISYTNVMNQKTNEMVKLVNEQKTILKSKIDDLFSLDSDKVLNEVNQKINNTLDSINDYNNYFESFTISNDIKEYLNQYGDTVMNPVFETFKIELNKATRDKIKDNIEKNSKQIESLNPNKFINQSNSSIEFISDNYITNITTGIESYGTNDYQNNLDIERSKKRERLRRRLDGTQTEEEIAEDSLERIADRGIEETFKKILSVSNSTKNYFDSLKAFDDFDKKMNKYRNNLNLAYKTSKNLIEKNEYQEEVEDYLKEKLTNLTKISNDYYDKINESYYNLRNYLNQSIHEIDDTLNKCANITYNTFNKEYEKIYNETTKVDTKYSEVKNNSDKLEYTKKTEHKTNTVTGEYTDLVEYGEFKLELLFEGDVIKKPKVAASIISKSRPKKLNLNISSPFGTCGENINVLEVEFNDANYTMNIDYNTESTNINVSTFTSFDKYKYSTEVYQIEESNETESAEAMGIEVNYKLKCKKKKNKVFSHKFDVQVEEKKFNETIVIQG